MVVDGAIAGDVFLVGEDSGVDDVSIVVEGSVVVDVSVVADFSVAVDVSVVGEVSVVGDDYGSFCVKASNCVDGSFVVKFCINL